MTFINKAINSIVSFIKRSGSIHVSELSSYKQLNLENIKNKYRLKEEGMERGANNHPPSDYTILDDIELKITSLISNELGKAHEIYKSERASYEARINSLKLTGHIQRLGGIADSATSNFESAVREIRNEKHEAKRDVDELEKHMDHFKLENNLKRPAMYPGKNAVFLRKAIIVLLVLIETLLNASFLANANELGLIGSASIAIVPSVINATLGCFLGIYILKWLTHIKWQWKIIGTLLFVAATPLILGMNLLLAHFRSAAETGLPNAATIAVHNFTHTPFQLTDVNSWFLFMIGCVFSLITVYDSWGMDDSYPGYGKLDRKRKTSVSSYHYGTQYVFDELKAIRDDKITELEEIHDTSGSGASEAKTISENIRTSIAAFNAHIGHLKNAAKYLLTCYRDKNIETRSDAPPEHFYKDWETTDITAVIDMDHYEAVINDIQKNPTLVDEAFKKCSARIEAAYRKTLKVIETIDEIKE